ncbi:hypothetical protein SLA2020_314370 [Shorea laevis]
MGGLKRSPDQLDPVIQNAETNNNGLVEFSKIGHTMAKIGHALTVEELTGMIEEADTNGDGMISFQEFSQAIITAVFDYYWT